MLFLCSFFVFFFIKRTMIKRIICIYKIICKDPIIEECYVGKTKNYTAQKCSHKAKVINNNHQPLYNFIRENKGWNNWRMCILERFEDYDIDKLQEREQYWRARLNAKLENNVLLKSKKEKKKINHKEYYQLNKNSFSVNSKKYRENNKEKVMEKIREWKKNNPDKVRLYRENKREQNLIKQKEIYQKNKEVRKQYAREYYHTYKNTPLFNDIRSEYYKQYNRKVECELCGSIVSNAYLKKHMLNNKCKSLFNLFLKKDNKN